MSAKALWQDTAIHMLERDNEALRDGFLKLEALESLPLEARLIFAGLAQKLQTPED